MLEYCTWLTNAAGDKQGSLSLRSNSMAFFLDLSPKYSSQTQNEWEFSCIARQRQTFPLKMYQILERVFQKIKVLYIQNALVYPPVLDPLNAVPQQGTTQAWKCCRLFFSSSTVCPTSSNENTAVSARVEGFFKESFQTKLKNKMFSCYTSSCEEFHHTCGLWAK